MTRGEVIALIYRVADESRLPRLLLLALCVAESNLDVRARRPTNASQDVAFWPDVSGGLAQQTVRYDPEYHGGFSFPGAEEVERILALQYDPERSLHVASKNLLGKWDGSTSDAGFLRAMYLYNWPAGGGKPYSAAHVANYTRGLTDAKTIIGKESMPAIKLSEVLSRARSQITVPPKPYVWAGKTPATSFDCSGFVAWCYAQAVTSYTDTVLGETERVASPAPGDIVLYEYDDPDQPDTRFPHMGLYLSDTRVLDARFGVGVGEHDQLPRSFAARYYRRLPGVVVDTLDAPVPMPPLGDPRDQTIELLKKELADARNLIGNAYNKDGEVRKALAGLRRDVDALDNWLGKQVA